MPQLKCIFTNIGNGDNEQNLYVKLRGFVTHSRSHGCANFTGFPPSTLQWFFSFYFWNCRYFFRFQNAGTPLSVLSIYYCFSLFQNRRWVSLWTHSSTVTRSTLRLSTGERLECVEVNTVCCCWLYWYSGKARGSPPLPKQLAPCGLHHPNGATSHRATLVHQFHLTINLKRTVEWQYCTKRLKLHHKLELETIHCSFLKYTKCFYLLCLQKCGCVLNCCTWPCAHTATVCVTAVSKYVAENLRLICHVQGWELIVP